jgi:hypothetical protein
MSGRGDYPDRDPQLFYELARDRLATQLATIDALDSKIGLLFSLASGLLGILAAVFAVNSVAGDGSLTKAEVGVFIAAGVAYVFVAWASVTAYVARSWKTGPRLDEVWVDMWRDDDALLTWKVGNDLRGFYELNVPGQKKKEDALLVVFAGVIIQTALLALAVPLVVVG